MVYPHAPQVVISGDKEAIDQAVMIAKAERKARRAIVLDVGAPFHCALMEPAAAKLAECLEKVDFAASPRVPIVWNVEGRASSKTHRELKDLLVQQVVNPVRWSQSMDFCLEEGAEAFVELGHGGVLTGLLKQQSPSADVR